MSALVKLVSVSSLALAIAATSAPAAGVFASFGGAYRGTGKIFDVNGKTESMSCRANNAPAQDGIAMNLSLVCASDSFRIDFHSDLYTDGHTLRGTWNEVTRSVNGNVSGTIVPDLISAEATAPGFTANIVIQVQKNGRLDVSLNSQGTRINKVQVSMKR